MNRQEFFSSPEYRKTVMLKKLLNFTLHVHSELWQNIQISRFQPNTVESWIKACANETKHINKDLPIYILKSFIFVNHHIGSWWTIRATDNVIFSVFYQLQSLSLPSHWMTQFFQAHVAIDLQSYEEGLERYSNLSQAGFSENKYILLQTALAQYHARGVVLSIHYNNRVCPNSCNSLSKA